MILGQGKSAQVENRVGFLLFDEESPLLASFPLDFLTIATE